MIPVGMPSGSTKLRPTVSASTKSQPPSKMATGINNGCLGPTKALAIWGAIKPIKAIPPVTETAEAARATAVKSNTIRSRSTEMPTPMATDSPSPMMFKRYALYKVKGMRRTNHGRIAQINGQSEPHIFPANHLAIKSTLKGSTEEKSRIITPDKAIEKPTGTQC